MPRTIGIPQHTTVQTQQPPHATVVMERICQGKQAANVCDDGGRGWNEAGEEE